MKVSIIVVTKGRKSLFECLKSLSMQSFKNFEIIVISSKKEVEKIIQNFSCKFVFSSVDNLSFQRNLGIKLSKGEIVCFIDDDTYADPNWLKELIKHYKDRNVACVGGRVIAKLKKEVPKELKELPKEILKGFLGETLLEYDKSTIIDKALLWGSNLSLRKEVLKETGLFDEKLGRRENNLISEEDRDIQIRIRERGYKIVYEPNAIVYHLIGEEKLTKTYFLRRAFYQGYSEILRLRNSPQLKYINSSFLLFLEAFFLEEAFKLLTLKFKEKVKKMYELGRIFGIHELRR